MTFHISPLPWLSGSSQVNLVLNCNNHTNTGLKYNLPTFRFFVFLLNPFWKVTGCELLLLLY